MRLSFRLLPIAAATAFGCASRGNVELLEARLRDQEDQLHALHTQVDRTNSELTAARRLNETLKQKLVQPAGHETTVSLTERQFQTTGLKINPLLTGGFNRDGQPGDDQVTLVVAPIDKGDQPVQLAGHVECELLDPARPSEQQRLGSWTFDVKQTNAAWQKTLGSFGYRFELPWQNPPTSDKLELRVRFQSEHGDRFETSATVQVVPPASLGADQPMP